MNYLYDGDGRRVAKVGSKLYWYGSGDDILAETDANGNTTAEYIFFGGKRIAMIPWSGTPPVAGNPTYYVEDMLGTSRVLATNTGVVCYDADFYPYGGERSYTNTCPQNYKFEGKERDTETGNDDFGARYYSNRFGRWLSADWSAVPEPVPYANLSNPQTLNLYSMVSDDPESFADLDGHCCLDWLESQAESLLMRLDKGNRNFVVSTLGKAIPAYGEATGQMSITGGITLNSAQNTTEAIGMGTATAVDTAVVTTAAATLGQAIAPEATGGNIAANAEKGAAFENNVVEATKMTDTNVQQQVTLKTETGVKTRMDVVSTKPTGGIRLQEAKSSNTAPLTPNQKAAHPEIGKSGATVVGKGKPGYPGGTRIPPTKVEVVRPKPPRPPAPPTVVGTNGQLRHTGGPS